MSEQSIERARERLYRTEGIVLRELDYAEADRILTVLTPKGKMSVLARGIRWPTSRKAGQLGLFFRVRLMLAKGRNLDTITQAECLEEFEGLRGDLLRFTYACYAGELVERLAQEEEDSEALYNLLMQTLRWFAGEQDLRLWGRYFELRLLACSGYQPELFTCVSCHETIQPVSNFFSAEQGGMLCLRCGQSQGRARAVSVNAQKVLRYLQKHEPDEVRGLRLSEATQREVESLAHSYMEYIVERELKSVVFLQRLRRELQAAASVSPANPKGDIRREDAEGAGGD